MALSVAAFRSTASRLALAAGSVALFMGLNAETVRAQDATWTGPGTTWSDPANWSTGSVPTGVATFSGATPTNILVFAGPASNVDAIQFTSGAAAYSFLFGPLANTQLNINGTGIIDNSANIPTFTVLATSQINFNNGSSAGDAAFNTAYNGGFSDGALHFNNSSTAGTATITNGGVTAFLDTSTAGNAAITNASTLRFQGRATGGNATIANSGTAFFTESSDGGNAQITNTGNLYFQGGSTAGHATIGNTTGTFHFQGTSTAGTATITNNATANFDDSSSAGSSHITNAANLNFNNTASAGTASITNNGNLANFTLAFNNASTAGAATITNGGTSQIDFNDTSSGGNAAIDNRGLIVFNGASSAGGAIITNTASLANFPNVIFKDTSSAGRAAIINNVGTITFRNSSTAANATISGSGGSVLVFQDTSTAGSATITNASAGSIFFTGSSTAGNAIITNFGALWFQDTATGGSARLINNTGGRVDFSSSAGTNNDGRITAGSIEGAGIFYLGARQLTVGGNDLSTTVSGVISDCSGAIPICQSGAVGGSLVKAGTGTLTLTGTNTYTGGTAIAAGTLQLGDGGTTGSILGNVANDGVLVFDRSNGYQFDGAISGSGAVRQNGSGTTSLTGANAYTGGTTISAGTLQLGSGGATGSIIGDISNNGVLAFARSNTYEFDGVVSGSGHVQQNGGGTTILTAANTYRGGTTIAAGTLQLGSGGASGSIIGDISNNGVLAFARSNTYQFDGVISGSGAVQQSGAGTTILTAANTYNGGTTIAAGTLQLGSGGASGSIIGDVTNNGVLAFARSNAYQFDGVISGTGAVQQAGTGTLVLSAANTYSGGTRASGGTLQISGAGRLGASTGTTTVSGGTLDLGATTQTQAAVNLSGGTIRNGSLNAPVTSAGGIIDGLGGTASLAMTSGTTALLGINAYTGATVVNGGTLDVEGTITGTSQVTVNAGGVLTGAGTIDPLTVTLAGGSTFAPGNGAPGTATTIIGNLALASGATYLVQLNSSTASFANVSGTATLGGATVNAMFAGGGYVAKRYTMLTAGNVSGTFGPVVNTNLPANVTTVLSYDPTHAYLDLSLAFMPPPNSGMNDNQHGVGDAMVNHFNANGGIPLIFSTLTAAGLTQASGELGTGSQQTTFDAMSQFMGLMTDPFITGRGDPVGAAAGPIAFADGGVARAASGRGRTGSERDAYAAVYAKASPLAPPLDQRWSVWAAGYGGSQVTDGNAVSGSNDTRSSIYGSAVGADYRLSPDTLAGFALAGGGTGFSVNGLGSGRSDLFQAGAFFRHTAGPAYLTGALAYGWQDITTDRSVTIAGVDRLRAEFKADAWSARVEAGYRLVALGVGVTPYAAGQLTDFDLPAYAESVLSGAGTFALNYAGKSVTDTRSELGLRTDRAFAMQNGILTLRGRFAWAHDFNQDRSVAATFQALPGASFVVNGASPAADSALTTASAEMKWVNGWSAAATFEGEFSNVTRSYAGKGVVRYAW
ncbi:autotransporter domain-containing protein [Bradyrhizobium cenepequi]